MSARFMSGITDHSHTELFMHTGDKLKIGQMVRRQPEPSYECECQHPTCGSKFTVSQSQIRNRTARCKATHLAPKRRDRLTDELRSAAQRDADRQADELAASERRMEFESEGYERPTRYKPAVTESPVMSERARLSLREAREAEEAEQRAADAPRIEAGRLAAEDLAKAEEQKRIREEKLKGYWRDWVLTDSDPKLFVSPELVNAKMPSKEADKFNGEQAQLFIRENPEYLDYKSDASLSALRAYLDKNGVHIFDSATIRAAFFRLRDLGIITKRPAPSPEPISKPKTVNLRVTPSQKPTDQDSETGWDWNTGKPLTLSSKQVASLPADVYRRFKKLDKEALALPNTGPGPKGN